MQLRLSGQHGLAPAYDGSYNVVSELTDTVYRGRQSGNMPVVPERLQTFSGERITSPGPIDQYCWVHTEQRRTSHEAHSLNPNP